MSSVILRFCIVCFPEQYLSTILHKYPHSYQYTWDRYHSLLSVTFSIFHLHQRPTDYRKIPLPENHLAPPHHLNLSEWILPILVHNLFLTCHQHNQTLIPPYHIFTPTHQFPFSSSSKPNHFLSSFCLDGIVQCPSYPSFKLTLRSHQPSAPANPSHISTVGTCWWKWNHQISPKLVHLTRRPHLKTPLFDLIRLALLNWVLLDSRLLRSSPGCFCVAPPLYIPPHQPILWRPNKPPCACTNRTQLHIILKHLSLSVRADHGVHLLDTVPILPMIFCLKLKNFCCTRCLFERMRLPCDRVVVPEHILYLFNLYVTCLFIQ